MSPLVDSQLEWIGLAEYFRLVLRMLSSNLGCDTHTLTEGFHSFPWSYQANARIVPRLDCDLFLPTIPFVHYPTFLCCIVCDAEEDESDPHLFLLFPGDRFSYPSICVVVFSHQVP